MTAIIRQFMWLFLFSLYSQSAICLDGNTLNTAYPMSDKLPAPIYAADCLIVNNKKQLLMITEMLSGKFSIPGGSIIGNESPQQAAKRETFEETGLSVTVGKQLAQTYNSAIFGCTLNQPAPFFNSISGQSLVKGWSAPHFGKEVSAVLLVDDDAAMRENYRFPEHKWMFPIWQPLVPPSDFIEVSDFQQTLSSFYQSQLAWVMAIHRKVFGLATEPWVTDPWVNDTRVIERTLLGVGSVFSSLFFIFTIAVFRVFWGHRNALYYAAALIGLGVFSWILNHFFAIPKPYFISAQLPFQQNGGEGRFTVSVVVTSFFFSWIVMQLKKNNNRYSMAFIGMGLGSVCLIALRAIAMGENYPIDVLISILLGVLWSGVFFSLQQAGGVFRPKTVLVSAPFWMLSLIGYAIIGLAFHLPQVIYLCASSVGVFVALMAQQISPVSISFLPVNRQWLLLGCSLVGIVTLSLLADVMSAKTAINEVIVAWHCATFALMPVWFWLVLPRVFSRLSK